MFINKQKWNLSRFMFKLDIFIQRLCCVQEVSGYSTVGLINAQSSGVTLVTGQYFIETLLILKYR